MMRNHHLLLLTFSVFLLAGCHKRVPVMPAPATMPPTIQPQPSPPLPSVATTPTETTVRPPNKQTASNSPEKAKPIHRSHKQKPSPSNPPPVLSAENVENSVENRPAPIPEPQITTPSGQTDHSRSSTEQLLETTDRNLLSLRLSALSDDDKATIQQIRGYQKDSRDALKSEDLTRAHNLAIKAQLLSNALLRAH